MQEFAFVERAFQSHKLCRVTQDFQALAGVGDRFRKRAEPWMAEPERHMDVP
jgi:hypothetical protein